MLARRAARRQLGRRGRSSTEKVERRPLEGLSCSYSVVAPRRWNRTNEQPTHCSRRPTCLPANIAPVDYRTIGAPYTPYLCTYVHSPRCAAPAAKRQACPPREEYIGFGTQARASRRAQTPPYAPLYYPPSRRALALSCLPSIAHCFADNCRCRQIWSLLPQYRRRRLSPTTRGRRTAH